RLAALSRGAAGRPPLGVAGPVGSGPAEIRRAAGPGTRGTPEAARDAGGPATHRWGGRTRRVLLAPAVSETTPPPSPASATTRPRSQHPAMSRLNLCRQPAETARPRHAHITHPRLSPEPT